MTISAIEPPQRRAAGVAGFTYLFLLVTAGFAEFFVRSGLIVLDDAEQTARNIVASERLFRLGIAVDLVAAPANVVLAVALYVILQPVNRNLAFLAALWRLAEATVLGVITFTSFVVLQLLGGAGYLQAFETDQLHALAALFVDAHVAAYSIGLIYFGLGSTVFSYLLFRSRYVPRPLAAWGMFSSLLLLACIFATIVFPSFEKIAIPGSYAPIGIFEIALGLWLLLKGLKTGSISEPLPAPNGKPGPAEQ